MKSLHDSKGRHTANFVNGQLHNTNGTNIGHYIESEGIFIDMRGNYFGEIVDGNRLLYNRNSPYRYTNFGVYGNYGNVGNYGNFGNIGSLSYAGFEDVRIEK